MEATVLERLEAVCTVIPPTKADELRRGIGNVMEEDAQEKFLWDFITTNYRVSIRCDCPDTLKVLAAYSGHVSAEALEKRLKEVAKILDEGKRKK